MQFKAGLLCNGTAFESQLYGVCVCRQRTASRAKTKSSMQYSKGYVVMDHKLDSCH